MQRINFSWADLAEDFGFMLIDISHALPLEREAARRLLDFAAARFADEDPAPSVFYNITHWLNDLNPDDLPADLPADLAQNIADFPMIPELAFYLLTLDDIAATIDNYRSMT